jgi:hypothetical protein
MLLLRRRLGNFTTRKKNKHPDRAAHLDRGAGNDFWAYRPEYE